MSIPFVDIKTQFRHLEGDIRRRLDRVFEHCRFIMGPEIEELEAELCRFVGVRHTVSCASGTDALLIPLMALGIGPGDAVFTTPFTFVATAEVITLAGATPVYVDIDPRTFNMDPNLLESAVQRVKNEGRLKPRAVIPVDLFGLPADYDAIEAISGRHELVVLEDAAQGLGGVYKGRAAGSFGQVAGTSFFPAKPLGCYGDGGAIFTDDDDLAEAMRSIRFHGKGEDQYDNVRIGLNGRLDTMQAAILQAKLAVFPEELRARRQVAQWYDEFLVGVETPFVPRDYQSAWAQYSVLSDRREAIRAQLTEAGIPSAVYYAKPLHLQSAYRDGRYGPGDMPHSEAASRRIFSLPMHPYLEKAQVKLIAEVFAKIHCC